MDKPSFEYVNGKVAGVDAKVGTLSNLSTTAKTDLVSAVNELFTSVSNGKASVASAITDKGVVTAVDATFAAMATNILAIPTGTTPTGTKQISITQNGTTTEDVAAYASAEITVNVSSAPTNYRVGTFTLSTDIGNSNVKVVDLDATALSHIADSNAMLAVFSKFVPTGNATVATLNQNSAFNGTRYGFSFYQTGTSFSSNVISSAANDTTSTVARAYLGSDGIYLRGSGTYKWLAGTYHYALVW